MHPLVNERTHTAVDDIPANENQVRLFGIHQIYPARQFFTTVVIAYVQVTYQHQFHGLHHRFAGGQMQFLAILMLIMEVAVNEQSHHEERDTARCPPVIVKHATRHKANQTT